VSNSRSRRKRKAKKFGRQKLTFFEAGSRSRNAHGRINRFGTGLPTPARENCTTFGMSGGTWNRVARWHIFKPKVPIWVNFGWSCNGSIRFNSCPFDLFYNNLIYFMVIWYILWPFCKVHFSLFWYFCIKKNMTTLIWNEVLLNFFKIYICTEYICISLKKSGVH
jgi:hypothetical protein